MSLAKNLGELKQSNYKSRSVKEEMKANLLAFIKQGKPWYSGIIGYENSVIPELECAILAGHNINFLGLRGQAKTRMARMLTELLDEYMPIVEGSTVNDDPLNPISGFAIRTIEELGDKTPITWVHRSKRYAEKLATPDVSIADLIGDIDPIKAMNLKLSFSDQEVINFGLIPRANRGIFVINELPDLQARIQVALFNVLQERDVQIRGFNIQMPLDVAFVFTANPEDYTNRGSIVTPLKDRIQSQILTHYANQIEDSIAISDQESKMQPANIHMDYAIKMLVEQVAIEARKSEYVDEKSGVSARLSISLRDACWASAWRRKSFNKDKKDVVRIADLFRSLHAINGKIELVYEGEQEGVQKVSYHLVCQAIRTIAKQFFPKILGSKVENQAVEGLLKRFNEGPFFLENSLPLADYHQLLAWPEFESLEELKAFQDRGFGAEFLLHALAQHSKLDLDAVNEGFEFDDIMGGILNYPKPDDKSNWN